MADLIVLSSAWTIGGVVVALQVLYAKVVS